MDVSAKVLLGITYRILSVLERGDQSLLRLPVRIRRGPSDLLVRQFSKWCFTVFCTSVFKKQ